MALRASGLASPIAKHPDHRPPRRGEFPITERFDAGDIEAAPVQVTTRNHTEAPIRLRSQWDGVALDLDVARVSPTMLPARAAIRATYRYHHERRPILVNTISAAIAVSMAFEILVTLALLITFTVL